MGYGCAMQAACTLLSVMLNSLSAKLQVEQGPPPSVVNSSVTRWTPFPLLMQSNCRLPLTHIPPDFFKSAPKVTGAIFFFVHLMDGAAFEIVIDDVGKNLAGVHLPVQRGKPAFA